MTAAPSLKSRFKYRLKIVAGPHINEVHTLDKDVVRIGRGEDNEIKLQQDGRISRNHIEISWTGTEFKFKNLSQKNFVMLDSVVANEGVLRPGSKLQIGETLFEVVDDQPALSQNNVNSPLSSALAKVTALKPVAQTGSVPAPMQQQRPVAYTPPVQQMPSPYQSKPARPQSSYANAEANKKKNFYIILGLVGLFFAYILLGDSKPKVKKTFRTSTQVEYDLLQSADERKRLEERLAGQNNEATKRAQENLIKGFRDFQQGNYSRARDFFQVVLNLDPENEVAKRYYHLSRIKFDELLQFHMLQGLRYRDKRNYRMCRSSFQSALVMIQNNSNHPKYREIKNFFDECNLALEGRF